MDERKMVFDNLYDALRHLVQGCGGMKKIGADLFPHKPPEAAHRYLSDCLNPCRSEKLDLDQVMHILTIGRDNDCHAAVEYICEELGYTRPEISLNDKSRAEVLAEYEAARKRIADIYHSMGADARELRAVR